MTQEGKRTQVISAEDYLKMIKGSGNKYNNRKTVIDGIKFDSALEARRWQFLCMMNKNGVISNLERQVRCELLPPQTIQVEKVLKTKTKPVTKTLYHGWSYKQDFTYLYNGEVITEDTKGMKYKGWEHVEKMFYNRYGRMIRIVKKPDEPVLSNKEIMLRKVGEQD